MKTADKLIAIVLTAIILTAMAIVNRIGPPDHVMRERASTPISR